MPERVSKLLVSQKFCSNTPKISLASPVPFSRIDYLSAQNLVGLGDIAPHPGGTYDGQLFDETDKELGQLYYDAEARLWSSPG